MSLVFSEVGRHRQWQERAQPEHEAKRAPGVRISLLLDRDPGAHEAPVNGAEKPASQGDDGNITFVHGPAVYHNTGRA